MDTKNTEPSGTWPQPGDVAWSFARVLAGGRLEFIRDAARTFEDALAKRPPGMAMGPVRIVLCDGYPLRDYPETLRDWPEAWLP